MNHIATPSAIVTTQRHSVEFFHIYTDEIIGNNHTVGLEHLAQLEAAWKFDYDRIVLIDNYNPTEHTLSADEVLRYLDEHGMKPKYWAYEADMVANAQTLLDAVTKPKLKKNYQSYIADHGKYPCSLLTASWYLARLGYLDYSVIKSSDSSRNPEYIPADRLFNLLSKDYRPVEERARKLILQSEFSEAADRIQDMFYPVSAGRAVDLF